MTWLRLESLTLIPFDTRLIDMPQLTADERHWLETYHQHVHDTIAPLLSGEDRAWLEAACTLTA